MREFADLRAANFALTAENAALRATRHVFSDFERGELAAFRDANDALTATNLALQLQRAELAETVDSLGGAHALQQIEGLRAALAEANQRAVAMDAELGRKDRTIERLKGEVEGYRQQVARYRTRVGEMTRTRPPVFRDVTNTYPTATNTTTRKRQPKGLHRSRDSIAVAKERSPAATPKVQHVTRPAPPPPSSSPNTSTLEPRPSILAPSPRSSPARKVVPRVQAQQNILALENTIAPSHTERHTATAPIPSTAPSHGTPPSPRLRTPSPTINPALLTAITTPVLHPYDSIFDYKGSDSTIFEYTSDGESRQPCAGLHVSNGTF
jgi:hypothetical protein